MEGFTKSSQRAPALLILIPLILGLLLAAKMTISAQTLVLAAAVCTMLALWAIQRQSQKLWMPFFLTGAIFVSWAYGELRLAPDPEPADFALPPRVVEIDVKAKRFLSESAHFGSGIGKVVQSGELSRLKRGTKVYFQTRSEPAQSNLELIRGQTLRIKGVLRPLNLDHQTHPFDAYLLNIGIRYKVVQTSAIAEIRDPPPLIPWCKARKGEIEKVLRQGGSSIPDLENVYIAMLLGEKNGLSSTQIENFTMTGTMHLFAISGLHIGVIGAVLAQTLFLMRIPRRLSPWIGFTLLYVYVEITGAAPSAVRALLMVGFFWLSLGLNRQRSSLSALIASASLVLIVDPEQLWQIGFQLSYIVVASILVFGLPFYRLSWPRIQPFQFIPNESLGLSQKVFYQFADKTWMLFSVSLSAWLASTPLSAAFFGYIAPYAILTNLLLVNLATLTITTGILSIALGMVGLSPISAFLNHAAWLLISAMNRIVDGSLLIPGATIRTPDFPQIAAFTGVILFLASAFVLNQSKAVMRLLPATILIVLVGIVSGITIS